MTIGPTSKDVDDVYRIFSDAERRDEKSYLTGFLIFAVLLVCAVALFWCSQRPAMPDIVHGPTSEAPNGK